MTALRPWIAYVAAFPFPEGGAGARRVLGNAQSLVEAGYDVTVVSAQPDPDGTERRPVAPGISVVSTGERDAEHLPRALKRARYALIGRRTREWIACQTTPPAAVILYGGYTPYLAHLTGMCRRRRIPLLFDAVEWYTADGPGQFLTSPYFWNVELAMRTLIPRLNGVIAISSYLAQYYQARGLPIAQVPPTLDTRSVVPALEPGGGPRLRLCYSGSASYDLLDVLLRAMAAADPSGRRLSLDIVGPGATEVMSLPAMRGVTAPPEWLTLHGRQSHAKACEITRSADFTVFVRHVNRISKAGFPTKFGESMAMGTPVITNLTSDLSDVLEDWKNGLACPEPTPEALCQVLRGALGMRPDDLRQMRQAARRTAEERFDTRQHIAALTKLLAECRVPVPKIFEGQDA